MQRPERFFWFCLLMIGVLSHTATLLIVIGMLVVAMLVWRRKISAQPVGLAIALGVLGEFAFALGVSYAIGSPPLRPPFLSARLIADGPGRTFLEKSCYPERRFVQCDFFRTFPSNSDAILWEGNGVGFISKSKAVQRKWSREDTSFAVAVVLNDPVSVARTSFFSILRQASGVRIDDVVTPLETIDRIPKSERARYNSTLVSRGLFPTENWNTAGLVLLTFAVGGLLVFWRQVSITGTIMLIGLIFDVVLCGALSTPHDRYLMRLVWILPLVALSVMPWELWATRQRSLMRFVWAQRYRRRTGHDDMMQVEVIRNLNGDRDLT